MPQLSRQCYQTQTNKIQLHKILSSSSYYQLGSGISSIGLCFYINIGRRSKAWLMKTLGFASGICAKSGVHGAMPLNSRTPGIVRQGTKPFKVFEHFDLISLDVMSVRPKLHLNKVPIIPPCKMLSTLTKRITVYSIL